MTQRMRNRVTEILMLVALALAAAAVMPRGYAAMIDTETAQSHARADTQRERVKALLARPDVARQLERMGVNPNAAKARVDAMSDTEVAQLAGRIDALPAGGVLSDHDLLVILLVVVIVALLL